MTDNGKVVICILLLLLVGKIGYDNGINKFQPTIDELDTLRLEHEQLNETYQKLIGDYRILEAERDSLKIQRDTLQQQITSYLLEQATIDLLGLKKYQLAWDLLKITMCNQSPSLEIC